MRMQFTYGTNGARRAACAAAVLAALALAGPASAWEFFRRSAKPVETVQTGAVIKAPHYGDTLFYFFQDRYFTSVTNLMASQQFERLPPHDDEAEVLRGGLFLSYGMHREAGQVFAQLIERGAPPPVRDRAWFYLAKIRYQRGYLAEAEDAIGRIEKPLPGDLEDDRTLLHAHLLLARDDFAGAAKLLTAIAPKSGASPYARYNLGVALIKSGESPKGSALLDEIGRAPAAHEEMRSLRDKANVALGYAALQEDRPEQARVFLERVRLQSLHANKALLGFGWAAAQLKQAKLALVPWMELAQRDASDAAVLEAKLAVPYALAELGALGQAVNGYEEAIAAYDREGTALDESIAAVRAGTLVDALLERNPGEEMGWFWNIRELPEMPHAGHLAPVLAEHEFQEAFKNYRDLQFLSRNLLRWKENLGVFGDMLANRREAYAERLPRAKEAERAQELAAHEQRRQELAAELARVEAESDVHALANANERELLARLDRARATLDANRDDRELDAARERYRRVAGAMTWKLTSDFPTRVWEAKKQLRTFDLELEQARTRDAALAQAQRDEPARFDKLAARIETLAKAVDKEIPRATQLAQEQQGHVQELAVAALLRQKERLVAYANQARFAVAQLYDRAHVARDANHAASN